MTGGTIDADIDVPYLHHQDLKEINLRMMPHMNLNEVYRTLPALEKFAINSVPLVSEDVFISHIYPNLMSYSGLTSFTIELLEFDIEKIQN